MFAQSNCDWDAKGQSIDIAIAPDRSTFSVTGYGPDMKPGIWTWPF